MTLDTRKLDEIIQNAGSQLDEWLAGVGEQILNDIKLDMREQSSGERQKRYRPTRTVIASKPGESPNVDLGTLINSLRLDKIKPLHYEIRDGVEYGIYLEDGTEAMGERPFVKPVFVAWQNGKLEDDAQKAGLLE